MKGRNFYPPFHWHAHWQTVCRSWLSSREELLYQIWCKSVHGEMGEIFKYNNLYFIKTCEAGLVLSVTRILRATLVKFRVYVCLYVCRWSNSSQTTEPICIKIMPANRAFYADCYRLLRFTKYDEYFVIERTSVASPQRRSVDSNDNVNDVTAEWRTQSIYICGADVGNFQVVFYWVTSVIYSILLGSSELGSRNSEIYENSRKQIKWRNFTFSYKLISI